MPQFEHPSSRSAKNPQDHMTREDIESVGKGETSEDWFYPSQDTRLPAPIVVLVHGLSALSELLVRRLPRPCHTANHG
ncbi:hypothetical protein AS9A_2195 [Hoyosella subflava DQS3-9A1]|uniref:Uncharacterized protein n=1 Tax=Hoyosella subflava (strain DSM 45089 / JCM 17490 / NBRC 109087 / DQS3-9A1) TaxID=443218 RepID=F6EQF9_HOYSD|nr:hypothetical protein AS9A_2195 [Hoyosella subflava DQS3-9A1]